MGRELNRRWRHLYPKHTRVVCRRWVRHCGERYEIVVCARGSQCLVELWTPTGDGDGTWVRLLKAPLPKELDPKDHRFTRNVVALLFG